MGNQSSCNEVSPDGRVLSFRVEGDEEAQSAETNTLELQRVFSWLLSACSSQCYDMLPHTSISRAHLAGSVTMACRKKGLVARSKLALKAFLDLGLSREQCLRQVSPRRFGSVRVHLLYSDNPYTKTVL